MRYLKGYSPHIQDNLPGNEPQNFVKRGAGQERQPNAVNRPHFVGQSADSDAEEALNNSANSANSANFQKMRMSIAK